MFLKHTYECLPYFSPDFKTSPELQDLFEFLKKLPLHPISIISYTSDAIVSSPSITSNSHLHSDMVSKIHNIKGKKHSIQMKIHTINITIDIFGNETILNFIKVIIPVIQFICSLSETTTTSLHLTYYLLDVPKHLPKKSSQPLTSYEINSGMCSIYEKYSEIVIYRKEEILKVTIHELIHSLKYDNLYDFNNTLIHKYQKQYNVFLKNLHINESYTELWSRLLHSFILSKNDINLFIKYVGFEYQYSHFQCGKLQKIIQHQPDLTQCSNIIPYYFITCELWKQLHKFLQMSKVMNHNYIKITKPKEWFSFILSLDKINIENIEELNKIKKNYLTTTLTMTILQPILF